MMAVIESALKTTDKVEATQAAQVAATDAMDQASVLTLSPNTAFRNERVLQLGAGLKGTEDGYSFSLSLDGVAKVEGGFVCQLNVVGDTSVTVPLRGLLATTSNRETLTNKTLSAPALAGLGNYADDAAAASGGVAVGGMYRNGSVLMVRVA